MQESRDGLDPSKNRGRMQWPVSTTIKCVDVATQLNEFGNEIVPIELDRKRECVLAFAITQPERKFLVLDAVTIEGKRQQEEGRGRVTGRPAQVWQSGSAGGITHKFRARASSAVSSTTASGVRPSSFPLFGFAPDPTSASATSRCPPTTACNTADDPAASVKSRSAPAAIRFSITGRPRFAAQTSGDQPRASRPLMFAPSAIARSTAPMSPNAEP